MRVTQVEEILHSQGFNRQGGDLVTLPQLHVYLDTLTSQVEKQFDLKIGEAMKALDQRVLETIEESKQLVSEKASKRDLKHDFTQLNDLVKAMQSQLDAVMSGYQTVIKHQIGSKVDQRELEIMDRNKADLTMVLELQERVKRVEEDLAQDQTEREEEDSQFGDSDIDDDELMDKVNKEIGGGTGENPFEPKKKQLSKKRSEGDLSNKSQSQLEGQKHSPTRKRRSSHKSAEKIDIQIELAPQQESSGLTPNNEGSGQAMNNVRLLNS